MNPSIYGTKAINFGILLLIILTVAQCNRKPVGDWGSTVTGQVTDSVTGKPIESAEVFYSDYYYVLTDSVGLYRMYQLGYPPDSIGCRMEGYLTKYVQINVITQKIKYDGVDLQLVPVP